MAIRPSVLSLSTITDYATVDIDGTHHRLLPSAALPIDVCLELEVEQVRAGELMLKKKRSKKDLSELGFLLDRICRKVLDAPAAVHAKLTDVQRLMIVNAFFQLPGMSRPRPAATQ